MDKKFIGIISVMVIVSILILVGANFLPQENETDTSTLNNTYTSTVFNKDEISDIYISISETDFQDMLENPTKEEYKNATVEIAGKKIENVGFRVKGNSSLRAVAQSDSDRYSFKIDFDQYITGQNLDGLTKLNLNNNYSDPSYMREYLSYWLLSEMDVPTPAFSYVNIYINDQLWGLYLAVEGIEEPFIERYYGDANGTLYKPEGQGADLVYTDDDIDSYSGISVVTGKNNGSDQTLLSMLKALNQGTDLEEYLNIDEILRYFAVNTVLVNLDSYQSNMKHNYYLYEEDGVFSILPWDYNQSFGGFTMGMDSSQDITSFYIDQPVSGTTLEESPLIGKLLEVDEYKQLYHQYIEEFISGPFNLENMKAEIERIAELIRPYVEQDPTKFYSLEQFEASLTEGFSQDSMISQEQPLDQQQPLPPNLNEEEFAGGRMERPQGGGGMKGGNTIGLLTFVEERIDNVKKQLSGELPSTGDSTKADVENLEFRPPGQGDVPAMPQNGPPQFGDKGKMQGRGGNFPEAGQMQIQNMYNLYIIGGFILILTILILIILRKKTKYSV